MPTTATNQYSTAACDPVFNADDAMASALAVHLKASTTFVAGTLLGEILATPGTYGPYSASGGLAAPAEVPVPTTATTGGTVAAGTYGVIVTYVNANGETVGSAAGSVVTTGSTSTLTVPSPPAESGATGWYAYLTQAGGSVFTRQQTAGSPTAIGTALTLTAPPTNTGAVPPTANTAGDGTQNPAGILRRAATTDSNGNIQNYDEWGATGLVATMFTQGAFRIQDLTGLDASAVKALGGHIVEGSIASGAGIFSF